MEVPEGHREGNVGVTARFDRLTVVDHVACIGPTISTNGEDCGGDDCHGTRHLFWTGVLVGAPTWDERLAVGVGAWTEILGGGGDHGSTAVAGVWATRVGYWKHPGKSGLEWIRMKRERHLPRLWRSLFVYYIIIIFVEVYF